MTSVPGQTAGKENAEQRVLRASQNIQYKRQDVESNEAPFQPITKHIRILDVLGLFAEDMADVIHPEVWI